MDDIIKTILEFLIEFLHGNKKTVIVLSIVLILVFLVIFLLR